MREGTYTTNILNLILLIVEASNCFLLLLMYYTIAALFFLIPWHSAYHQTQEACQIIPIIWVCVLSTRHFLPIFEKPTNGLAGLLRMKNQVNKINPLFEGEFLNLGWKIDRIAKNTAKLLKFSHCLILGNV